MRLISRQEWAEFSKTFVPILERLESALRRWGPHYEEDVARLIKKAKDDPQGFVSDVYDGFLWGGSGSVLDSPGHGDVYQALVDLADALKSIGLTDPLPR